MRNLKKILSLALALVMVFSLMTFVSAREFNDAADIEHSEAVEVMSSLGVINGMGGNMFNPKGNVTRGEMAKMITYISLGNVEPTAFLGTTTNLTDINGHWAEAYIKYCYSQGIISGRGNGIFDPNASVTATEAARMLLVAIGYNADVQVYTGSQWAINVVRDAQLSHLYDEVSVVSDEVLNRDKAAQMMYNALNAKTIVKSSQVDRVTGDITDIYTANGPTLLAKSYEAKVWIGTFAGNHDFNGGTAAAGEIRVNKAALEEDYTDSATGDACFPFDFDIANIGEEVKVIFKDGTSGRKNIPDKQDTIYGVYKTGATSVVTGILGDVKDQKSNKAQINIGGTKYDTENNVTVWTNFASNTSYSATDGNSSTNSALTTALKQNNGNTIKAVLTDGKIDTIYVTESKIAAVTAVNSEKVSMNNGVGTVEFEDNDIYSNIARGDVVVVTTLYSANAYDDDAYVTVAEAEVVTGTVTGFKDTENVVLDGTTYKINNKAAMLANIPGISGDIVTAFNSVSNDNRIGESFDLYLINGYVGAAVQTSESANNYSVILDKDGSSISDGAFQNLRLQVMSASGEKTILTVADDSKNLAGNVADANDFAIGDIVVWSGSANDATVTVKAKAASGSGAYRDNTKAYNGTVTASDCVLFATTKAGNAKTGDVKAYDLRSLKNFSFSGKDTAYVVDDNNRVVAVYAALGARPSGAAGSTVYGIVSDFAGRRDVDGDYYYQYTVSSNDDRYTINVNSNSVISKGDLVYFDPASDSIYSSSDLHKIAGNTDSVQAVYVDEYDEGDKTLTYFTAKRHPAGSTDWEGDPSTRNTLALEDDCVIVYVDVDGDKQGSNIGIDAFSAITGYKNVVLVTEGVGADKTIVAILVETSNEEDILSVPDVISGNADGVQGALDSGDANVGGDLSTSSTEDLDLKGNDLTVGGDATIAGDVAANGGNVTLNGDTNSVTGDVTLAGGTLTLNGATSNTVSGAINLGTSANKGTIDVKKDATLSGAITGEGTVKVAEGATLTLDVATDISANNIKFTGEGHVVVNEDMTTGALGAIASQLGAEVAVTKDGDKKVYNVTVPTNVPKLSGDGKITGFNGALSITDELSNGTNAGTDSSYAKYYNLAIPEDMYTAHVNASEGVEAVEGSYFRFQKQVNGTWINGNGALSEGTYHAGAGGFGLDVLWVENVTAVRILISDVSGCSTEDASTVTITFTQG